MTDPDDQPVDLTPPQWHRDVVEVLEDFLQRAKRGEVRDVAVVAVTRTGGVSTAFAGGGQRFQLIAGAHLLLSRLVSE